MELAGVGALLSLLLHAYDCPNFLIGLQSNFKRVF